MKRGLHRREGCDDCRPWCTRHGRKVEKYARGKCNALVVCESCHKAWSRCSKTKGHADPHVARWTKLNRMEDEIQTDRAIMAWITGVPFS